jgi:hypothetical protein
LGDFCDARRSVERRTAAKITDTWTIQSIAARTDPMRRAKITSSLSSLTDGADHAFGEGAATASVAQ